MKIKAYKYLLMFSAVLLLGSNSYSMQVDPVEPVQPEQLPAMPMTDSFRKIDLSKMRIKMEKLNKIDFKRQTLAMQKSFKKLQESMDEMGSHIGSDFNSSFKHFNNQESNNQEGEYVKVKNYSKSYSADVDDQLNLSNTYGRITVNTWTKNEVKVDVQIKASADRESVAQKGIDMVDIEDSKDGNVINFKTRFSQNNNWNQGNRQKIDVNYTVYMPAKMQLDVKSNYCSIILPDLSGLVRIKSNYSNVTAKRLSNPSCEIAGNYGNFKIVELNGGRINVNYGDVSVNEVNNIRANMNYGNLDLGRVKGAIMLNLVYVGDLKITEVDNDLKNMNINSTYSTLNLGFSPRSNFKFDVVTTYAGFKFDEDKVNITERMPEPGTRGSRTTNVYRGVFGKGSSDAQVKIVSTYGSVKFD